MHLIVESKGCIELHNHLIHYLSFHRINLLLKNKLISYNITKQYERLELLKCSNQFYSKLYMYHVYGIIRVKLD